MNWTQLSLPAIAPSDKVYPLINGGFHIHKAGEALFPEREPAQLLEAIKSQIGSAAFSAQYLQSPEPPGGAMIKRAWVMRYDALPSDAARALTIQSWDTANKGGPENDYSVCTTWRFTEGGQAYLIHVWRQRVDYPALKAKAIELAKVYRADRVLIEDAGSGISLFQELRGKVRGVIKVKPHADKIGRMSSISTKFEEKSVFFPKHAPWLADLEAELFSFPGGRHDDQCDSISQALDSRNTRMLSFVSDESAARARLSAPPRPNRPHNDGFEARLMRDNMMLQMMRRQLGF